MARSGQKDLLTRLTDAGEAAIKAIGDAPGADRFLGAANALRDRLDELQRRVRGLEGLEQRLAELERTVERLAKSGGSSGSSKTSSAKKGSAKKS
jgi:uncharacterized protein involved in exopolysaccharide biosynthesis